MTFRQSGSGSVCHGIPPDPPYPSGFPLPREFPCPAGHHVGMKVAIIDIATFMALLSW